MNNQSASTMPWNAATYDASRRCLVPCFDAFYGAVAELVAHTAPAQPRILDLGAGTGIVSAQVTARVRPGGLTLQDGSGAMLAQARKRVADFTPAPRFVVCDFRDAPPPGEFDVVMSALAIHHLEDGDKRALFARVHAALAPGGLFVNAEQVLAPDAWQQSLYTFLHYDTARRLGGSEAEIAASRARKKYDRCATVADQLAWLRECGFVNVGEFFHSFRFSVYAGWKAPGPPPITG
ncbi:MAG: class I SAM-dependent methyltransferase [Opitutaceae bacterium]|nr:class I SAM-dependent methyltransferase [Opitutaceae bacterium]